MLGPINVMVPEKILPQEGETHELSYLSSEGRVTLTGRTTFSLFFFNISFLTGLLTWDNFCVLHVVYVFGYSKPYKWGLRYNYYSGDRVKRVTCTGVEEPYVIIIPAKLTL